MADITLNTIQLNTVTQLILTQINADRRKKLIIGRERLHPNITFHLTDFVILLFIIHLLSLFFFKVLTPDTRINHCLR